MRITELQLKIYYLQLNANFKICLYHYLPLIEIKDPIQTRDVELEDETYKKYVEVIVEKVTFLSIRKEHK